MESDSKRMKQDSKENNSSLPASLLPDVTIPLLQDAYQSGILCLCNK